MTIYRRGNVWWANIRIKGKPQVRQTLNTMDREEAKQRELELRLKLYNGDYKRLKGLEAPALEDALSKFIEENYSESTARIQRSNAVSLGVVIGMEMPIDEIDEAVIEEAIQALKKAGNAPATINRKMSLLQATLKAACYKWKVIHSVPHVSMQKEPEGRIRVIEPHEEEEVYTAFHKMGEHDYADLVMFLIDTGVRLNEALRINYRDINWESRSAFVWQSKNGRPRVIGLTDRVLEVLHRRHQLDRIHGVERPFGHINRPHLHYVVNKIRRCLGLANDKEFTLHALRHTCASRLVRAGVPLYTVQRVLGHSSIKATERYSHLDPASIDEARKVLNKRAMEIVRRSEEHAESHEGKAHDGVKPFHVKKPGKHSNT